MSHLALAFHGSRARNRRCAEIARASTPDEASRVGNQTGGRVFLEAGAGAPATGWTDEYPALVVLHGIFGAAILDHGEAKRLREEGQGFVVVADDESDISQGLHHDFSVELCDNIFRQLPGVSFSNRLFCFYSLLAHMVRDVG
jgi:hypothetical protein